MDRKQKVQHIANQSGVARIDNLKVVTNSIHANYQLVPCDGIRGETGSLEVLKLVPKTGSGPYFVARWDQPPEELDIDIRGAPKNVINDLKHDRGGYSGHHTNRSTEPDKRVFDVRIVAPQGVVFDGRVSFSRHYEMKLGTGTYSFCTVDTQLVRAPKSERS